MLLQVVRQPTEGEMARLVERIKDGGLTRDDARKVRQGKTAKAKSFTYRSNAKNQAWSLTLRFRKAQVSKEEVKEALAEAIALID
jgi:hypothetical protein